MIDFSKVQVNPVPAALAGIALIGLIVLAALGKVDTHEVFVFVTGVLLPAFSPKAEVKDAS